MPNSKKRARPASSTGPLILIAAGTVLILIVLILSLINSQANGPQANALQPTAAEDIPYPEISRISLKDSLAAYDAKTAIFLDVRSADSYEQLRIPGAINIPLEQIETTIPDLDRSAWIIPYCT